MSSTTLGQRVRELRQARAWTLAVLASESGLSISYLNDIEHDRHTPSLGRLAAVASALGLSVTKLLAGTTYDDGPHTTSS